MSSSRNNKGKNKRKARVKRQQNSERQATARMVKPVKSNQRSGRALSQRAMRSWDRGEFDAAIKLFTQDQRARPGQVDPLLDLGKALGMRYQYERSEKCLAKALKLSGENPKCLVTLGEIYHSFSQFDIAEDYFRRAVEGGGETAGTSIQLATICERLHRLDEAGEHIRRALEAEPDNQRAHLIEAKLARRSGDLERAESLLRQLLESPQADSSPHWEARYALGALLDQQGDYDSAMHAFIEAKKWHRGRLPTKIAAGQAENVLRRNRRLLETISAGHLARWNADPPADAPPFALLCGHPRSGTTLIEQVLDSHAGLVSSDETQIMAEDVFVALARDFPTDLPIPDMLDRLGEPELAAARERYFRLSEAVLREPVGGRILLDKNPELTLLIPVIARVFPQVKIVFAQRDPRDVCLSCFMQALPMNSVSVSYLSLKETCEKYASVMGSWLAIRPLLPGGWTETRYEDNVADLEAESRRLLEFLGLPWDADVLEFYEHARQKHVRSPTYEAVTQPVHSGAIGRWRHYEKYFEPLLETLEPFVTEFGYQ